LYKKFTIFCETVSTLVPIAFLLLLSRKKTSLLPAFIFRETKYFKFTVKFNNSPNAEGIYIFVN